VGADAEKKADGKGFLILIINSSPNLSSVTLTLTKNVVR